MYHIAVLKSRKNLRKKKTWAKTFSKSILNSNNFFINPIQYKYKLITSLKTPSMGSNYYFSYSLLMKTIKNN